MVLQPFKLVLIIMLKKEEIYKGIICQQLKMSCVDCDPAESSRFQTEEKLPHVPIVDIQPIQIIIILIKLPLTFDNIIGLQISSYHPFWTRVLQHQTT